MALSLPCLDDCISCTSMIVCLRTRSASAEYSTPNFELLGLPDVILLLESCPRLGNTAVRPRPAAVRLASGSTLVVFKTSGSVVLAVKLRAGLLPHRSICWPCRCRLGCRLLLSAPASPVQAVSNPSTCKPGTELHLHSQGAGWCAGAVIPAEPAITALTISSEIALLLPPRHVWRFLLLPLQRLLSLTPKVSSPSVVMSAGKLEYSRPLPGIKGQQPCWGMQMTSAYNGWQILTWCTACVTGFEMASAIRLELQWPSHLCLPLEHCIKDHSMGQNEHYHKQC